MNNMNINYPQLSSCQWKFKRSVFTDSVKESLLINFALGKYTPLENFWTSDNWWKSRQLFLLYYMPRSQQPQIKLSSILKQRGEFHKSVICHLSSFEHGQCTQWSSNIQNPTQFYIHKHFCCVGVFGGTVRSKSLCGRMSRQFSRH